ncbi:D-alanine--poly(phosphoribitol) ligase [Francisella sp. Scap27]|uniref:amino acid adenylation domain-containing protein n=1 Tax=Francisella sp. Scap27 TaxID=2589986 RepID=UPI0015C10F76|nr:amino acid adenylation domain-containing protein [Francisella sp. Scap27]QLE78818.1 D-alanine--poly(phosphoribitol) ligase [Francisella sp. Scap27]
MAYFNLADYFYDIVYENSEETVLIYEREKLSYNELNSLSNRIANYFLSLGVKPHDVVGIFNTKEIEGYASMLACLKIGAAYTNIDEETPPLRLEKILTTCSPRLLVSDHPPSILIQNIADDMNVHVTDLSDGSLFNGFGGENIDISSKVTGNTIAYIMFTSGSTGNPKGVAISHSNILSFLQWSIKRYSVSSKDRFAQLSPMYFDNSVFDFYTAIYGGACLVPIKKELTQKPLELVKFIDANECTIWFSVPSLLVYLLTMRVLNENSFKSIRVFTFGGEGFPKGELKKLYNLYRDHARIINVYGPTEGTCICSSHDITEKDFEDMNTLAPLGIINSNFEYLIVDENMQITSRGEKGELCLLGPNVATGYYNDIERTEQSFVQNPLIATYKDTVYKTGDIVYEKGGLLWFAGRVDNQIKHMGYRIELEEIESALNSLDYVNQSAALYIRERVSYGKIIAFISTQKSISESQIKNELFSILPSYMIPNIVVIKNKLPRNANGKVDKAALEQESFHE